jgi:hypothetical protein
MKQSQQKKKSAYTKVTESIGLAVAERLEKQRRLIESPVPVNAATGVPYSGINVFLLLSDATSNRRSSNRYVGESQARKMGMQPLKTDDGITIWRPYFRKEEEDAEKIDPVTRKPELDAQGNPVIEKVQKEVFLGCGEIKVWSFDALVPLDNQPADLIRPVAVPTLRDNPVVKAQLRKEIPESVRNEHQARMAGKLSKPFADLELRLAIELAVDMALVSSGVDPEPFLPIAKSADIAAHLREHPSRISPCLGLATRAVRAYALTHPGLMPVFEVQRPDFEAQAEADATDAPAQTVKAPTVKSSPATTQAQHASTDW